MLTKAWIATGGQAGLGVALGLGMAPPPAMAQQPPIAEQLRVACRNVAAADLRRLRATEAQPHAVDFFDSSQPAQALEQAAGAARTVKLVWARSGPEAQPSGSTIVWKTADGRWLASSVFIGAVQPGPSQIPWPHEPGVSAEGLPLSLGSVTEGELTAQQARDLELLLASDCLADEPQVRSIEVPMRSGPAANCSWHPTSYVIEVTELRKHSRYVRHCTHYRDASVTWPSDLVLEVLGGVQTRASASPSVPRTSQGVIPSGYLHKWGPVRGEGCATAFTSFEITPERLVVPFLFQEADSFEVLGQRTLRTIVRHKVTVSGSDGETHRVEEIAEQAWLLLSPDGNRLAVAFDAGHLGTITYDRCEGRSPAAKGGKSQRP